MTKKLPVIQSAREVFSGVTRHYFDLLRSAPVASLAYLLGLAVLGYIADRPTDLPRKEANDAVVQAVIQHWPLTAAGGLLVVTGFIAAAVRWHRFVLLGERGGPFWGRFEARYLWTGFKLILCAFLLAFVGGLLLFLVSFNRASDGGLVSGRAGEILAACILVAIYFGFTVWLIRVSVAFPDAALGKGGSIGAAYRRTTGNAWRLLGYSLIVQVPLSIGVALVQMAIAGALAAVLGASAKLVVIVLMLPVSLYVAMIGITMLSVAYRELVGLPPEAQGEPSAEAAFPA